MPALFAYLIALGLLLGGGYGALSWLAAPEPVKVVAKAKSKPPSPPHRADTISGEISPPEPGKPEIADKTGSNDKTASVDQVPSETAAQDTKAASSAGEPISPWLISELHIDCPPIEHQWNNSRHRLQDKISRMRL